MYTYVIIINYYLYTCQSVCVCAVCYLSFYIYIHLYLQSDSLINLMLNFVEA